MVMKQMAADSKKQELKEEDKKQVRKQKEMEAKLF
jgi:hypothetical protein